MKLKNKELGRPGSLIPKTAVNNHHDARSIYECYATRSRVTSLGKSTLHKLFANFESFNSYTQETRIDNAVLIHPKVKGPEASDVPLPNGTPAPAPANGAPPSAVPLPSLTPPGKNPNQIVTYSSRSIDNMADIIDALNISSSLSIKYGTIKGSGSASYVNENKVNDSDLNFIVTVKVGSLSASNDWDTSGLM